MWCIFLSKSYVSSTVETPRFLDEPSTVQDSFFFQCDELPGVVACSVGVKFPTLEESSYRLDYKEVLKQKLGWDMDFV